MKELGGYFEFSLPSSGMFPYPRAIKYNSGRSAFYDLLIQTEINRIWMPKFICNSMIEPLMLLKIDIQYYNINESFYPQLPDYIEGDEYIFYVNYFGLCTGVQKELLSKYPSKNIIFDHSQAFFISPLDCFSTIYSPRKFLPIAEGGLLISQAITNPQYLASRELIEMVKQYDYCLTRRLSNASEGYNDFKCNEELFSDCIPKNISDITDDLLNCFDYESIKKKRLNNFKFLHSQLKNINQLAVDFENIESPLVYPLLLDFSLADRLIENKIFTPTYWIDSLERLSNESFEYKFISQTTNLICDQRYSQEDMQYQVDVIKESLK